MKSQYLYSENINICVVKSRCRSSHLHEVELDFLKRESDACLTFHSHSAIYAKLEQAGFSGFGLFGF